MSEKVNSFEVTFFKKIIYNINTGYYILLWGDSINIGNAVKERIIELCSERHITVNKLATISGVTQSTLSNIISGRNNSTTISTIKKLCDGLEISIVDFFNSDKFHNLEQEIK